MKPKPPSSAGSFEKAFAAFKAALGLGEKQLKALEHRMSRRGARVAGVAQLRVADDVMKAIDRAVEEGTSFQDFKKSVGTKLKREWKGTVENPGARVETIFRTNIQTAYAAGRMRELMDPDTMAIRPFWRFTAVMDLRTTEEICRPLNGTVLPARASWWTSHTPPLHFRCRSAITSLTQAAATKLGVTHHPPAQSADDGFGSLRELETWAPDLDDVNPDLAKVYRSRK